MVYLSRAHTLLLIVFHCSLTLIYATSGVQRLKWMKKHSQNGVINCDSSQFNKYVLEGSRPYGTVVIFNAKASRFKCPACQGIATDTSLIASSLATASGKLSVFLVEIEFDYKDCSEVFENLGLQNAPRIVYVPPEKKVKTMGKKNFISNLKKTSFDFNQAGFDAEAIVAWINKMSGINAIVSRPIDWAELFDDIIIPFIIALAPLLIVGLWLYRRRRDARIYFALSLCMYIFSVSGGMFNVLKNTPWMHHGPNGEKGYFHDGNGWQLGSESYICGVLQTLMGLIFVLLNSVIVTQKSSKLRNFGTITCAFIFIYLFGLLRHLVTRKMEGYNRGWLYQWM